MKALPILGEVDLTSPQMIALVCHIIALGLRVKLLLQKRSNSTGRLLSYSKCISNFSFNPDNTCSCYYSGVLLKDYWRYLSLPDIYADKGNKEILEYMRQVQLSLQSTILYRMKVMLIGPGDAGKTTLVHRIMTGEFRFGQFSMTDGVSMKVWKPLNV